MRPKRRFENVFLILKLSAIKKLIFYLFFALLFSCNFKHCNCSQSYRASYINKSGNKFCFVALCGMSTQQVLPIKEILRKRSSNSSEVLKTRLSSCPSVIIEPCSEQQVRFTFVVVLQHDAEEYK